MFYNEKYKELRKLKRWTIVDIAKECGVSRQTAGLWERGDFIPKEENIRKIAKILGVNISEISDFKKEADISEKSLKDSFSIWSEISESTVKERHEVINSSIQKILTQCKKHDDILHILRTLIDTMDSIFYVKDCNLKYLIANNAFKENLKLKKEYKVTGKTDSDFFNKEESELNHHEDINIIRIGDPLERKESYIIGSRKKKWGLTSKFPIYDEEKKVIGILSNTTDITKQRKQEIALLFLISKMEDSKGNMLYGIFDLDSDIEYTDRESYQKILGIPVSVPEKDILSYFLENICHPDYKAEQEIYYNSLKFPEKREFKIIHPEKGLRWIRTYAEKRFNMFISYSTDITEEKQQKSEK